MYELFNPAGLRMLEDAEAAVAFGYVAPRVFYARFVGRLSATLGDSYLSALRVVLADVTTLAYFADASALRGYDHLARNRFEGLVRAEREKFASIVLLTQPSGASPASRAFADVWGEIKLLSEPLEFERALCNVAPFPDRTSKDWAHVWQEHLPR
ncbi:MAG: hypothetical protein K0R38_21 [Polyangiaceae bacterium]|jgi:hypothetical protein|nr:hypothetical protein [Polyangiaceae bacterium]